MFDAQRVPLLPWLAFAPLLWLSGCLAHQAPSREWLVYVREVPVARVTLAGASHGNVVDVAVRGATADVTLRHRGRATVTPVQEPPGMKVALREVDVRALARGEYDEVERALEAAPPGHADDTAREVLQATADEEVTGTPCALLSLTVTGPKGSTAFSSPRTGALSSSTLRSPSTEPYHPC